MKFSFQTVCIVFVVALTHLVVLATISPVSKKSPNRISESKPEPSNVEENESFPVQSGIPLTEANDEPEIVEAEEEEPPAVSIPRDERVKAPKPADLAETSTEKRKSVSDPEVSPSVVRGPHEIRRIDPKPSS